MVKEKEGDPEETESFRPKFTRINASEHEGYDLDFQGIDEAERLMNKRLVEASDRSFHSALGRSKRRTRSLNTSTR